MEGKKKYIGLTIRWGRMEIRTLGPSDAELYRSIRLKALLNHAEVFATSYEEESNHPIEKYRYRFQSEDSITIGAFENGELVGVVTLVKEKLTKLRHKANVAGMYVSPEKQGLGIGKALLQELIKKAKDSQDIEQLLLTVVSTNNRAKKLYSSLGFEVFGIEKKAMKIEKAYFDEEHMVLFLA
jgi:ribosomal protein S18 acetylase RimI-like enzyme